MKVWVLIEIELLNERESSDYSVVGVFSSREKAVEKLKELQYAANNRDDYCYYGFHIETWEVQ